MVAGEVEPQTQLSLIAISRKSSAGTTNTAPFQSNRRSTLRSVVRGITNQPITAAANASGTFTQNTQRQLSAASSAPPTAGPAVTPTAWIAAKMPMARPCRLGPAALIRMTRLLAANIAPPIP
jgi:hypothetical protein